MKKVSYFIGRAIKLSINVFRVLCFVISIAALYAIITDRMVIIAAFALPFLYCVISVTKHFYHYDNESIEHYVYMDEEESIVLHVSTKRVYKHFTTTLDVEDKYGNHIGGIRNVLYPVDSDTFIEASKCHYSMLLEGIEQGYYMDSEVLS